MSASECMRRDVLLVSGSGRDPSATIVIPTFNRRDRLLRLLRSLSRASRISPSFEAVVVVDGSTDGTAETLATLCPEYPLRVLSQPNRGPAAARNRAIAAASGDVLIFL